MAKVLHIELVKIDTEGMQTRAALNMEAVREYAEAEAERGSVFPPVILFYDGSKHWLADGFHRVAMARQQGRRKIAAEVREGTASDALWFACGANKDHGLPRTNADKRRALEIALKMHPEMSHEAIALHVGVSRNFVANMRKAATDSLYHGGIVDDRSKIGEKGQKMADQPVHGAQVDYRVGTDGIKRSLPPPPVRRAAPNGSAATPSAPLAPPPTRRPVPAFDGPADSLGKPVPPDLLEVWNRRREAQGLATAVSRVRTALRDAQDGNDPLWSEINYGSVLAHMDMEYKEIAAAEPWCVCPMCQGIGCEACRGRGLMGKFRWDNVVPESLKRGC